MNSLTDQLLRIFPTTSSFSSSYHSWDQAIEAGYLEEKDFFQLRTLCEIGDHKLYEDLEFQCLVLCLFISQRMGGSCLNVNNERLDELLSFINHGHSNTQSILNKLSEHVWENVIGENENNLNYPLLYLNNRLYFQKDYCIEKQVELLLRQRIQHSKASLQNEKLNQHLKQCIEENIDSHELNSEQINAIAMCQQNSFTIISGGPGTGKTTIVSSALFTLCNQKSQQGLEGDEAQYIDINKIALTAPTGRAAGRLIESVREHLSKTIKPSDEIHELLENLEATTIHKLLQVRRNDGRFTFNANNLLDIDLLIVDECSMIDLYLMHSLLSAVPEHTKIILLGDSNQLPSVESGQVFNDILNAGIDQEQSYAIRLIQSYRSEQYIQLVAKLVLKGDYRQAWKEMEMQALSTPFNFDNMLGCHRLELKDLNIRQLKSFRQQILSSWLDEYWHIELPSVNKTLNDLVHQKFNLNEIEEFNEEFNILFKHLNSMRILTATRGGVFGVEELHQLIENRLNTKGHSNFKDCPWPSGTPIMITHNDPRTGLYNGDVGILLQSSHSPHQAFAVFQKANEYKVWPLHFLNNYEMAYVSTIHKSQGSEYDKVMILLGDNLKSQNRQLLFTALTRAKKLAILVSQYNHFQSCVQQEIIRDSGLNILKSEAAP